MNQKNYVRIGLLALAGWAGTILLPGNLAATAAPTPQAPSTISIVPPANSPIVTTGPDGQLGVAQKDGTPIEGFKLSQHDFSIASPSIAVAPDGTIHVAFVEQHNTTFAYAIYHRSSSDGGKTWTDAKNLTEDIPDMNVGRCQVLVDAHNRVYVIWRATIPGCFAVSMDLAGSISSLWYRELEAGKWTKAKPVAEMGAGAPPINDGAYSFFAVVDAAGQVQVVWNAQPDKWHPEVMTAAQGHSLGVGNGLVFQCELDGATPGKPHEVFLPAITPPNTRPWPNNDGNYPSCDDLDTLNGYVDSAGAPHFVALAQMPMYGLPVHPARYEVIENGKAGAQIQLPALSFHASKDIPTLLVDAKGRQHVIALFLAGEHPNFRDYLIGSDDDPTVILAAKGDKGVCVGFQAYQGPGGQMVVLMQTQTGEIGDLGDTWVSTSNGTEWSKPICVTNNAARKLWATTNTGAIGSVSHGTAYHPGLGAAAFDNDGHLVLAVINGKVGSFGSAVGGVLVASGGSEAPMLFFYKF